MQDVIDILNEQRRIALQMIATLKGNSPVEMSSFERYVFERSQDAPIQDPVIEFREWVNAMEEGAE